MTDRRRKDSRAFSLKQQRVRVDALENHFEELFARTRTAAARVAFASEPAVGVVYGDIHRVANVLEEAARLQEMSVRLLEEYAECFDDLQDDEAATRRAPRALRLGSPRYIVCGYGDECLSDGGMVEFKRLGNIAVPGAKK